MPDSLWGDSYLDAATNLLVDVRDIYYASSRKQILDNKELLVQTGMKWKHRMGLAY